MTKAKLGSRSVEDIDNEDRVRVLGIVDRLRELGINEDISLPQLVVVGDQSSGKSSLLEGLTGLNFPIASELCTRFATQIILRRAAAGEEVAKVSILPGPTSNNDEEQKRHLQAFSRELHSDSLGATAFANILNEAAAHMGLPTSTSEPVDELPKRFSDDILRIELAGPEHHHLSVVDVPGLFHNPTKFQTQEDLNIIRALLERYMTDKRTIILAVMDARNNLANQEVFRMARAADASGKRTVGIITKCDALQAGDEQMVLSIAQNAVERLTHGWFAVKNRSTQDIQNGVTIQQRHQNERAFFATKPWQALPKDRVGISALKKFLGKLLYDHIKGEFPALVEEIRTLVTACRNEIDALGSPRQTTLQQRQFLSRVAAKYQQRVVDSLKGNYHSEWDANDAQKLRMHLHLENERFAVRMADEGHTRSFKNADDSADLDYRSPSRTMAGDIYSWIRQRYRESRGAELPGTVNPSVLESLFRQQAAKWQKISAEHLKMVDTIVSRFNEGAWQEFVPEEDLRHRIEDRNGRPARAARENAVKQLDLLIADEMNGILQTANHYFADTLSATRQERVLQRLKRLGIQEQDTHITVNLAQVAAVAHLGNEEQAIYDIHDILKAYYKVAIKRFIDNVVLQAVERCYLGEHSSVTYIRPEYIGELSDEELDEIAAESYATSSIRIETTARLERLEKALSIAESEHL